MYWSTAPGGTQQPEQAEQELEQERAGRRLKRQELGAGGVGGEFTGSSQITSGREFSSQAERKRREQI